MIEAMVSVALVTIGIVSILAAYTSLGRNQRLAVESETMQRLAIDKYDELVATEALQSEALNGDFSDRQIDGYLWDASVQTTSTTDVSTLTVTVQPRDGSDTQTAVVSGVVYQAPQTSSTSGGPAPGGTPGP